MTEKLGPAWVTPGGRYNLGVWHGYPFHQDDPIERYITSQFGAWEDFRKERGWGPHQGVDIHATVGTPLYALADGKIENAGYNGFYPVAGMYVQILHEGDIISQYLHMSAVAVTVGNTVKRGQFIGKSGNTSSVPTVAHLHLSVKEGHITNVNPEKHIYRQPEGPQLDRETAQEWFVSEYFLNGGVHGGSRSMSAPRFDGFAEDGKTERWQIEILRPALERPLEEN